MVATILQGRAPICMTNTIQIGANWAARFLSRHPDLEASRTRAIERDRLLGTSRPVISAWFQDFANLLCEYHIKEANMWNMNEKEFAMGVSGSCTVIRAKDNSTPFQMQSGN